MTQDFRTYTDEELFNLYTTDQQIKDSFERSSVPTGTYTFHPTRCNRQTAGEKSPWPGRNMLSMFGGLLDENGKKFGNIGVDASFDVVTKPNGKQDNQSSLWGQLVVALGMKGKSHGEVINQAGNYSYTLRIAEVYTDPMTGKFVTIKEPAERARIKSSGIPTRNFINSLGRIR